MNPNDNARVVVRTPHTEEIYENGVRIFHSIHSSPLTDEDYETLDKLTNEVREAILKETAKE